MRIGYGNGGWVRVDDPDLPGPLYLRYDSGAGRPVLTEMYLDGRGHEIATGTVRNLDLTGLTALVAQGMVDWVHRSSRHPGVNLSTLASYYATTFTRKATHWVADAWRSEAPAFFGVKPVPRKPDPEPVPEEVAPPPVERPNGLTDDFLRSVAENYVWAIRCRQRPAPTIAEQTGYSVRTVHAWIRKARAQGILPPAKQGRVG